VLYVCEGPSDPAVLQGVRFFGEATFTHPYDVIHSFKYLHVDLQSVWAFNKRSGAVLKKGGRLLNRALRPARFTRMRAINSPDAPGCLIGQEAVLAHAARVSKEPRIKCAIPIEATNPLSG